MITNARPADLDRTDDFTGEWNYRGYKITVTREGRFKVTITREGRRSELHAVRLTLSDARKVIDEHVKLEKEYDENKIELQGFDKEGMPVIVTGIDLRHHALNGCPHDDFFPPSPWLQALLREAATCRERIKEIAKITNPFRINARPLFRADLSYAKWIAKLKEEYARKQAEVAEAAPPD